MRRTIQNLGALTLCGLLASVAGCKNPEIKQSNGRKARSVQASIADFDPEGGFELDLEKYQGGERPDDYQVSEAFNQTFGALDECVAQAKEARNMGMCDQMKGDADVHVRLNPEDSRPLAVHADIAKPYAKDDAFVNCVREAVASAPFPTYDGPPVVANFTTQIDPGCE